MTTEYTNLVSNTFSNEAIINQPAMMTAYHDDKAVSEKPIKEEADHVQEKSSTKQDGVFTPTNFKHMSREQLIARLLVLENEKSSSNNNSKSQQQPVITRCRWKGCTKKFDILKKLISHLTEVHVGGGKVNTCPIFF